MKKLAVALRRIFLVGGSHTLDIQILEQKPFTSSPSFAHVHGQGAIQAGQFLGPSFEEFLICSLYHYRVPSLRPLHALPDLLDALSCTALFREVSRISARISGLAIEAPICTAGP